MNDAQSIAKGLLHLSKASGNENISRLLQKYARAVASLGQNPFSDVGDFHDLIRLKRPTQPTDLSADEWLLRRRLMREEYQELMKAMRDRDLVAVAQESIDVMYVAAGNLDRIGIDGTPIWALVHGANMKKEPHPEGGKAIKPVGWEKPDVEGEVWQQMLSNH